VCSKGHAAIPVNQAAHYPIIRPAVPVAARLPNVDPPTDSDAPIEAIRAAINDNVELTQDKNFSVATWKETNTYTRKINDETVTIIELHGTFQINPSLTKCRLQG
jgi:hypothetical protein